MYRAWKIEATRYNNDNEVMKEMSDIQCCVLIPTFS